MKGPALQIAPGFKPPQVFMLGMLAVIWPGSCVLCEYDPEACGPYGEWVIERQAAAGEVPSCHEECDGAEHRLVDQICYCAVEPTVGPNE